MVVIEAKLPSGYSPDKKSVVEVRSPLPPSRIPHPTGPCPWGHRRDICSRCWAPMEQLGPLLRRIPAAEEAEPGEEGGGAA